MKDIVLEEVFEFKLISYQFACLILYYENEDAYRISSVVVKKAECVI